MAVNRFYRRTPYDAGLYVAPVEVIAETLKIRQAQHDKYQALTEEIKNQYIPSLPQDRAAANGLQAQWTKEIDDIVAKSNGDYSTAAKDLNKTLARIRKDLSPGGVGKAIVDNYSNYSTWLNNQRERVKSGKVLAEDLSLANNYYMKNYTGIGDLDPVTQTYNQLQPDELMDHQNAEDIIQNIYKQFKPEKKTVSLPSIRNGIIENRQVSTEGIEAKRLYPSFATALSSDPKLTQYLSQRAKFAGLDPNAQLNYIDQYSKQRAQDLSYMNESDERKWTRDPLAVARVKAQADKENMQQFMSFLQHEPLAPNTTYVEPKLNPDNWRGDFEPAKSSSYMLALGLPGGKALHDPAYDNQRIASNSTTLDAFLNDPKNESKLLGKNVMPELARQLWNKKKNDFAAEYSQKYGKDPNWTKEFERNFIYDYGKEAKNNSAFQTYSLEIPEAAQKKTLQHLLRDVMSGQAQVYRPGEMGIKNSKDLDSEIINSFYDEKEGKLRDLSVLSVDYVPGGPGYQAAGYQVNTPAGTFVVKDQNAQRSAWGQLLASSMNPIYFGGMQKGGKGLAGVDNGRPYFGTPEVRYEPSNTPGQQLDMNIYWDYGNGQVEKKNPSKLLDEVAPLFWQSLGFGQTKAAATPFSYFLQSQQSSNDAESE